ncbi:CDP-diacylglycerol--serine O-phosphatidyltransferase [Verrucomicrobiota bacterium]|nr:CDP-diacylglycerol--serine O-phosphatidyltransferase [Verrucomicrobiota bacterium]GDY18488.1 CDP-diacylglycerol--serine O-phosphatidyltransferase [Verrucomicrobiota bacterium]
MSNHPEKQAYSSPEQAARIYLLPNLFTAGNMLCGFLAIKNCIEARFTNLSPDERADHYLWAVWFILGACLCDLFDGRVARATRRESLFGAEFDSIADTVSFGVAPALMACFLIINPGSTDQADEHVQLATWLLAFIYLLCVGVRLARFNVLTNPLVPGNEKRAAGGDFVGLPSPAAAGMMASLVLVLTKVMRNTNQSDPFEKTVPGWSWSLLPLMLIISYLMISNVRFPSFKNLDWTARAKTRVFILIIILGAILIRYPAYSFPALFLGYIVWSIFRHLFLLKKSEIDPAPEDDDEVVPRM